MNYLLCHLPKSKKVNVVSQFVIELTSCWYSKKTICATTTYRATHVVCTEHR